jgi:transglutaminase-like putative cysteine protease
MQSASPNQRFQLALVPGRVWGLTRASMTGAAAWSALLILLLTFAVARSTVTAGWVGGIDVVTPVALGGALLMGVLAVAPVPWGAALGIGFIGGPLVAAIAAGPALHASHPLDTVSIGLVSTWWGRITDGSASSDPAFYLYLISLLMWVTGGWLSWCVLRWRRPMLGLVPGAAAFATNVLNNPIDQNGYTLAILVLTLALLLWTNYTASIANATRAHVKLTGDARWDFWESGLVAMAALIVLGIMLPPLSTVDRTVEMESNAFSSWAQLQQRLSHATSIGQGSSGVGTTGFAPDVSLGGPLKRSRDVVFTYTFTASTGPRYFRGLNETLTFAGEWRYPVVVHLQARIAKNTIPPYAEDYLKLALTAFNVKMLAPPVGYADILFYPGALYLTDRESLATQVILPPNSELTTIDRLSSVSPPVSIGNYNVTVEYSTATEADLQNAGTAYPDWLSPYESLPETGYRSTQVLERIHQLALQVTQAAGAVTPYDKAKAIEAYLRDASNYKYTLTPPATPAGVDPLSYFLFDSKQGYCEFFASAMGDMLRSLGIPTRLVNGFGPGQYDTTVQRYVVRAEDAHTWVEVFFPSYGWNTFEPTPDGVYTPFQRGSQGPNTCLRDSQCTTPTGGITGPASTPSPRTPKEVNPGAAPPSGGNSGISFRLPDAGTLTKVLGIFLAVLLVLFAAAARYLRPRSVMNVWKRTIALARLAGAERLTGETPLELGRRLAHTFPEASEPVRTLADGFVVSAYAPPDLAGSARASVMDAWAALRPLLLRRVASRLRPSRP